MSGEARATAAAALVGASCQRRHGASFRSCPATVADTAPSSRDGVFVASGLPEGYRSTDRSEMTATQAPPIPRRTPTFIRATARPRPGSSGKTARKRRLDRATLRVITLNVRSLRRPEAYDLIINYMHSHDIHVAALQET